MNLRLHATKILEAERDQEADLVRIDRAIANAETHIAALKSRVLDPEELRKRIYDVRDRTVFTVRDVRKNMTKRATNAKSTKESLTNFLRERSRFAQDSVVDAKLRASFFATLQNISTFALLHHFIEAIRDGDAARSECIRFEFQTLQRLARIRANICAAVRGSFRSLYLRTSENVSRIFAGSLNSRILESRVCCEASCWERRSS